MTEIPHKVDAFNGVLVTFIQSEAKCAPIYKLDEFQANLRFSLQAWASNGRRGVWLTIPIQNSDYITVANSEGFQFHHAKPTHSVLTLWLPEHKRFYDKKSESADAEAKHDDKNLIPLYASYFAGVGGLVLNSKGQVLVILEKYIPMQNFWKLPGGAADPGEELTDAAAREVKEETGIDAQFVSLLGFRHLTSFRFGCDDFYFVVLLRPKDENQSIAIQPEEIVDCKWLDLNTFLNLPSARLIAPLREAILVEYQRLYGKPYVAISSDDDKSKDTDGKGDTTESSTSPWSTSTSTTTTTASGSAAAAPSLGFVPVPIENFFRKSTNSLYLPGACRAHL